MCAAAINSGVSIAPSEPFWSPRRPLSREHDAGHHRRQESYLTQNTGPTPACRTDFDDGCSRQLQEAADRWDPAARKATDAEWEDRGSTSVETEKGLNAGMERADVENLDVAVDER